MELQDVIAKRHTVRKYKSTIPPQEDIEKIINSARLAPSAKNLQNWMFIAVYDKATQHTIRKYVEQLYDSIILAETDVENKTILEDSKKYSVFFTEAPVVIVVVETPHKSVTYDVLRKYLKNDDVLNENKPDSSLLSIGAAIENMILTATDLGYGTCWMAAPVMGSAAYKSLLDISGDEKVVSLLTVGISDEVDKKYSEKKPLSEIMKIIKYK